MRLILPVSLLLLLFVLTPARAAQDDWVVGTWQLVYDPHDGEVDHLEFLANGDVIHRSSSGEYHGFYIVGHGMVKAVLTVGKKDLILSFFYNEDKNRLRIVTSDSGIESVYEKVNNE